MRYTCWGAARQVTGSMHLLTTPSGFNILIDCGLDYEKRDQFEARNAAFPFDVSSINLVILTHAHIDHSGNMPNLVRQGFHGQVLCTGPTRELSEFLLKDSLNIQRAELARHQQPGHRKGKKKKGRKFGPERQPLYSAVNIRDLMAQCVEMPFRNVRRINDEVSVEFFPAGHILGAASVTISIETPEGTRRVGFTGDLGNWGSPLVVDPEPMPDLDYLISESTYGGRLHQNLNDPMDELSQYIEETCVKYNGKLVIPAFSVGRTQSILYTLNRMHAAGRLPKVRVFTDSPLAIKSTQVYARYVEQLNEDARHFAKEGRALFEFPGLQVIEDELSTEIISSYNEPVIIVSSAGMVEGGRIQEHVRRNIQNPFATILIAGYCAEGTLGYRLLHGQRTVEINRTEREVYARVSRTDVFSAHPDHKGLMRYLEGVQNPALKGIFLVHGDATCMEALQKDISFTQAHIPGKGQQYVLN
ncbi:MAG: MBL fold metallo-hydrolase [Bacteroidetes bacterium]|nr:MBL fold metallo-hydrolase [Bacteroidota bacterium]